jgi:uncharacterized protein (TIGR02246 family)
MHRKRTLLEVAICAALLVGVTFARGRVTQVSLRTEGAQPTADAKTDREADAAAIRKSAQEFSDAFAKGDAKALAAQWTDMGECHDADGTVIVGRADLEKSFAAHLKEGPKGTIEVDIRSIRFPSRDTAIEEGFLRFTPDGPGLPASTMYTASHVREDGQWKLAYSREWGAGQDRLGDLAFLIGKWQGGPKGQEITVTFEKDGDSQFILGRFSKRGDGKSISAGTMKIGFDGKRGQIRSWHFDNDGGHGQCLWIRERDHWVLDAIGVLADGAETDAVNLLGRLSDDEITWRSIDRVVGGKPLPDTTPIKLTRAREKK